MRFHPILLLTSCLAAGAFSTYAGTPSAPDEPSGTISLRQAVALALVRHPELAAYSKDIRIADAQKLQAGLKPNPVVDLSLEDIVGSGGYNGFDQSQNTLQLSQLFELGDKRATRVRAAETERVSVQWDYQTKRLQIAATTVAAFVDVLAAQRRLIQMKETQALAEKFAPAAQKRVDAGRASPVEVTRANVVTASAKIAVEQQEGQLTVSRKRLAALWGSTKPRFSDAVGDLDQVRDLPTLTTATGRLEKNPLLARGDAEITSREAKLAVEQAKRHPDLTVSAGVRQYSETKDVGAVLGFSLPWPLFNRNQGNIAEAQAQIEKARDLRTATKVQLSTSLAIAYEQMENAKIQITSYRASVLPQVEEAYKLTNEGYENGRFGYLEVLDAQRTLSEARQRQLESLIQYHKAVAEIEGLTGQALPGNK